MMAICCNTSTCCKEAEKRSLELRYLVITGLEVGAEARTLGILHIVSPKESGHAYSGVA